MIYIKEGGGALLLYLLKQAGLNLCRPLTPPHMQS